MTDAVVVGAGPNGLTAAVTLARAGCSVVVLEASGTPGGGCRTEELTLPGFLHDVCAAIHPLGAASPAFAELPLGRHGLEWLHPQAPAAHPLPDGRAAVLERSIEATAESLSADGRAWRRLMGPLVDRWEELSASVLGPLLRLPRYPVTMARFGVRALWPSEVLARRAFDGELARGLFAGLAAHAILDLRAPLTSSFALTFAASGHAVGWPAVQGGSQRLTDALVDHLTSLGGEVATGHRVASLGDLPPARTVLFDLTPRQLATVAGDRLEARARRRLARFRYGPASFKVDYALDGPVPWKAQGCDRAGSVHLGGTLEEVAAAERDVAQGRHPERPFLLTSQPSRFDPTRAPPGKHTFWAYCHVPHGSTVDMTTAVEDQVERFAPGFRDRVLARHTMFPADLERHNANNVGGDVAGGSHGGLQLVARPRVAVDPYRVPIDGMDAFLCSASTPPGPGVHGMCGWWAAHSALKRLG
ncbi:MAG TPA: NAD(P)/FAD-dependent oxidoreductase [Acidimicrobiales bacterium]|nr:NAD(P)/FAD-dependent oxidoreductase [Acidimicrobiales bacterium]